MKVTPANNRRMVIVSVVCIVLLFATFYARQTGITLNIVIRYALRTTEEITFLAMIWYVISILQFAGETVAIQTPFNILLGLDLIYFLMSYFKMNSYLRLGMGLAIAIVFIYATINTFRIKNKELRYSFRVVGITSLFTAAVKFSLAFFLIPPYGHLSSRYLLPFDAMLLAAILYLIVQTGNLLKINQTAPIDA